MSLYHFHHQEITMTRTKMHGLALNLVVLVAAALGSLACSDDSSDGPGTDAAVDGGDDAGSDTGTEGDAGADAGDDASTGLEEPIVAVFGGGPFYSGGTTVIDDLKASGFNTVFLWSLHVGADGATYLNDAKLTDTDGKYVGNADWPKNLAALLETPTSVNRIEISVGSGGDTIHDWANVRSLIASEGTGPDSTLYKAFKTLKSTTGAVAVDYDNEDDYDVDAGVAFSTMLADLGYGISLCPYESLDDYWAPLYVGVEAARPGAIDRVYLQVYGGGWENVPSDWDSSFGELKVTAGMWSLHGDTCEEGDDPAGVKDQMTSWKSDVAGGFIFVYDDITKCTASGFTSADYAGAIHDALD
jgi:hypothetical protein